MEIIDNALTAFLLTKQKDVKLHKYTRQLIMAKQVLESHVRGLVWMTKHVKQLHTHNKSNNKQNRGLNE